MDSAAGWTFALGVGVFLGGLTLDPSITRWFRLTVTAIGAVLILWSGGALLRSGALRDLTPLTVSLFIVALFLVVGLFRLVSAPGDSGALVIQGVPSPLIQSVSGPLALPQSPAVLPKPQVAVDERGMKWLRSSPQELHRYLNSLPPGMRHEAADDLVGLQVRWAGKLVSVREEYGKASLQLIADDLSHFRVTFFAAVAVFPGLKHIAEGVEIKVEGTIQEFMPSLTVYLEPAEVA